jgi:hypothetical protein
MPRLAPSRVRRASWGAIFAGMFVTVVLQVMFTLLGVAVGLASINPPAQATPGQSATLASAIWLLVTGLVSIWIGACIAGRLSGEPRRADGMLHGIVAWSVSMVATFYLLATAVGALLGGTVALVGGALAAQSAQPGGQESSVERQVKALFPQTGSLLPPTGPTEGQQPAGNLTALAQQDPDLAAAVARMEAHGGAARASQERDQVINLLTTKHNLGQQDAANLVNQWDQQFQQLHARAVQQVQQTSQAAAHGIAQGAFWGFLALVLGLLVAAWGGWAGTASLPRPTEAAAVTA